MSNALKPPPQEFPPFNRDPALAIEQAITALKTIVERHPEVTQDFDCEAFVHHELAPALNALRSETAPSIPLPAGLNPTTADLVVRFATALAEKLRAAEGKYGYSDLWKHANWQEECRMRLREHLAKGDPRDVANYCMFMWHHGWSTALPIMRERPTKARNEGS